MKKISLTHLLSGIFLFALAVMLMLPGVKAQAASKKAMTREAIEEKVVELGQKVTALTEGLKTAKNKEKAQKDLDKAQAEYDKYKNAIDAKFTDVPESVDITLAKGKKSNQKVTASEKKFNALEWKSSDNKVATVTKKGVIKAVGYGTAKVTATLSISGATYTVNVTVANPIKKIFTEEEYFVYYPDYKNGIFTVTADITPENFTEIPVVTVSDETLAKYSSQDSKGNQFAFKIKKIGKPVVTISGSKGVLATFTLDIAKVKTVSKITLESDEYTAKLNDYKGKFFVVETKVSPSDFTEKISVEVENEGIAKYSSKNNPAPGQFAFKLKDAGKTEVILSGANGTLASFVLEVTEDKNIKKFKFKKKSLKVNTAAGGNFDLEFQIKPAEITEEPEWVYDEDILKFVGYEIDKDGNGKVTFNILKLQDTSVSVKLKSGAESTCALKFDKNLIPIENVSFNTTSFNSEKDDVEIFYIITPADSKEDLIFSYDMSILEFADESRDAETGLCSAVFEIDDIKKAREAGSTSITVSTKSGKSAVCTVIFDSNYRPDDVKVYDPE